MKKIIILLLLCFAVSGFSYDWIVNGNSSNVSYYNVSSGIEAPAGGGQLFVYPDYVGLGGSVVIQISDLTPNTVYDLVASHYAVVGGTSTVGGVTSSWSTPATIQPQFTSTSDSDGKIYVMVSFSLQDTYTFLFEWIYGTARAGEPPLFDPNPLALDATLYEEFSHTFSVASGATPITYTFSGLPSWLTSSGSSVTGTPNNDTDVSFQVTATNDFGSDTLTVNCSVSAGYPPSFTPNPVSATATVGQSFSQSFSASGTSPITYTFSNLPSWLSANGNVLSGTPTTAGSYVITLTATNNAGFDTLTINMTVEDGQAPVITSPLTINATAMQSISYTITATGTPTIEYDFTNFPSFLSVSSGSPTISGTLPFGQTNFSFGILATNQYGADTKTVNVVIDGSGEGTGIHVIVDNFADLNNIQIFQDILDNLEDIKTELYETNATLDLMYTELGDVNRNLLDTNFILDDINVILTQIQAGLSSTYTDGSSNDLDSLNLPSLPDQTDKYTDAEVEAKKTDITQIAMIKTRLNSLVGIPSGDWYFEFPLMWTGMVAENPKILLSESIATWIAWARKLFQIMVYACGWLYWFDILKGAFIV